LDEKIRKSVLPASFISKFNNDVHVVVADGYLKVLGIFASLGKIIMCLIFWVFLIAADKDAESHLDLYLLPAGTILILIIVVSLHRLQRGAMRQSNDEASDASTKLVDYVNDVIHNFRTIADYFARPLIAGKCNDKNRCYNAAAKQADVIHTTPHVFIEVTFAIISSLWLLVGGMPLAWDNPPLSLGGFLVLWKALQSNGDEMQRLYSILQSMKRSIPAFWGIVQFLNMPTDLHKKKKAAEATSRYQDDCICKNIHFDHFPLLLDHVTFGFKQDAPLVKRLRLEIEQGKLIQVSGRPGTGKKSFLELLSQVHILTAGDGGVFVPEHLKVLNVCSETHILDGTLAYNLFLGVLVDRAYKADKGIEDAEALLASLPEKDIERGKRICARLGLRQDMLDRMFDLGSDELATLSRTTRHLIHLARAFIYNPGVLVVHTPLAWFDEELGRNITGALKEFVQHRGLELDPETSSNNSARTCIFSTCLQEDLVEADVKLSLRDGQLLLPGREPRPAAAAAGLPRAGGPALLAGGGARGPAAARFKGAAPKDVAAEVAADAAHALDAVV
jgi:ABC-type multidrug transport system fused ATPase/permease subunit